MKLFSYLNANGFTFEIDAVVSLMVEPPQTYNRSQLEGQLDIEL